MSKRRITLVSNKRTEDAKILNIDRDMTMSDFLRQASTALRFPSSSPAVAVFDADGRQLESVDSLKDNDVAYISAGEPFFRNQQGQNDENVQDVTYSIAVMGAGSVGKSAVTLRFVQGVFVRDYDPTIEDAYRKSLIIDNRPASLDILDTAGQEDYMALRSTWMRERDGFLLVYSVTDRNTFESLHSFYEQLSAMHEENMPPIVLVGNKCDMATRRVVKTGEGKKLAESWSNLAFIETSAKTGDGIDKAFATLVREIRANTQPKGEDKPAKKRWCTIL